MLLGTVISSLSIMFTAYGGGFLYGRSVLIGGVIGTGILCELLIVLFKIHEKLNNIANKPE